jgi:hypothetical protein
MATIVLQAKRRSSVASRPSEPPADTRLFFYLMEKSRDDRIAPGPSKTWIKVKNPKAPAATRAIDDVLRQ